MGLSYSSSSYGPQASVSAVTAATAAANSALTTANAAAASLVNIESTVAATTTVANEAENAISGLTASVNALQGNTLTTGANTFTGAQSNMLLDYGVISTGSISVNFLESNAQRITIGGPITMDFADFPPTGTSIEITLDIVNGGSSIFTLPNIIIWQDPVSGEALTFTEYLMAMGRNPAALQVAGTDSFSFRTNNGGTSVIGKLI